jgi:ferric-dicitrate binding protein FerR (iron transport regulator)
MDELILKYFARSISSEEMLLLKDWLKSSKNKERFREIQEIWELRADPDVENGWTQIQNKMNKKTARKKPFLHSKFHSFLEYAAAILIAGSVVFLVLEYSSSNQQLAISELSKVDEVTLEVSDGTVVTLDSSAEQKIEVGHGAKVEKLKGNKLIYSDTIEKISKPQYNTISIPNGKQFFLNLSDGTRVWLNSGSSLKYPVKFMGKARSVELIGEAFFEVAHDKSHPFIVEASGLYMQVLGTRFNVNSYPLDSYIKTTLVEGLVKIYPDIRDIDRSFLLKPNQQAVFRKVDQNIEVRTVDPYSFHAWKEGKFIFISEKFCDLRQRLERRYGIQIKSFVEELEDELFSGDFSEAEIEDVLMAFQKIHSFEWKRQDDIIIIMPQ